VGAPKVALVTGGTRGLGAAMSEFLLREGWLVYATYRRNRAEAQVFEEKNCRYGGRLLTVKCDIGEENESEVLRQEVEKQQGYLDLLVNNAGINLRQSIWDITNDSWDSVLDTNLKNQFFFTRRFWDLIGKSNLRRVVFISSAAGEYHGPKTLHYAVSKAGLISMAKVFARYGVENEIHVNTIAPGLIETEQTRSEFASGAADEIIKSTTLLQRQGSVKDVVSGLKFLIDEDQRYMTGQVLSISGGAIL
jgi:3-oxoacyl-[acyl-carrier protein] reductase